MKRMTYVAAVALLAALTACQNNENKIVSPPASEPATAVAPQQPARLDTAMKSSQHSAAAVAQQPATTETAMKQATETGTKEAAPQMAAAPNGAALAKKRCGICHFLDVDKQKVGPSLKGVYGRAPSIEGVPFAKWDAAALEKWLTNPRAVKAKTKMAFPGFPNKADRDAVIAYLKTL